MTTVGEALGACAELLEEAGCDAPRLDAELLLGEVLEMSRSDLYLHSGERLSGDRERAFDALVDRRAAREPLAYILGRWGFRHLELSVDRRVLVPRPETEQLVEVAIGMVAGIARPRILDVGTGSGAIALALASELAGAVVTGVDVSEVALDLAQTNGQRLGVEVEWLESDVLSVVQGRTFDLIVSNPPYVPIAELEGLEPEVRSWEPWLATTPGPDGLALLRVVAAQAFAALAPGGSLAVECGHDQAAEVAADLAARGYRDVQTHLDLEGVERFVSGRRP